MSSLINLKSFHYLLKIATFTLCFLATFLTFSQQNEALIGSWTLNKIESKRTKNKSLIITRKDFAQIYQTSLLSTLDEELKTEIAELELINIQAEEFTGIYFQSKIEFQPNGAFYNTSEKSLSGEYLIVGKKLIMEWETAIKTNYKIMRINASELILNDADLKVIYYYNKTN